MWFFYALTFAIISSVINLLAKKILGQVNEYLYLWLTGLCTIPFLFLIIITFYRFPNFDMKFILFMAISITLDVIAGVAAYKAIKLSEISLVAPIAAFNPVFTALISMLTLHEIISFNGWVGIILVCFGAFFMQSISTKKSFYAPVKAFFYEKGIRLSLLAYFIWAITPTLQKMAIFHTYPQTPPFIALVGILGANVFFGLKATRSRFSLKSISKFIPLFIFVGFLTAIGQAAAQIAFSMANLGFATAIFKLSIIFTVILSGVFLREHHIKKRLVASMIMLIGVYLLVS